MITRKEVYEAIDSERDYQDKLGPDRTDGRVHTVGDFILMMEEYMLEARQAWVRNAGDTKSLDSIRKVAGIAVNCMETWGAPKRK